MQNKCKYISELEKKISNQERCWKILLTSIGIIIIIIIAGILSKDLFLDKEGKFSNELFWSALGAIGSMIAFGGVIYTIWYTENARRLQNAYEYKKQQLTEEQWRFNEQVLRTLTEIDPVKFIELIARVDVNNFLTVGQELTVYMASLRKVEYQLYWYYDKDGANTPKLTEFLRELNNIIELIKECVLDYSREISPAYCDLAEKNNLFFIKSQRKLNESEEMILETFNMRYLNGDVSAEILKRTNNVSSKIIEYKNKNWNDYIELGKEVVKERKAIIDEALRNI